MNSRNSWPATALLGVLTIFVDSRSESGQGNCGTCVDGPEMFEHRKHQQPPDIPPVELTATDLGVVEVCLDKADLCLGPVYSDLSKSQFRSMNGSFVLSCDEVEVITDEYRKSCSARFQEAHAALTRRWKGILEFFPLRDSDVQPAYPCVDFADGKSGELIDGWCGQQLQIRIRFACL